MSELFDRADEIFTRDQMKGKPSESNVDSLLSRLRIAESNLKALEKMKSDIDDPEGIVAGKMNYAQELIDKITKELEGLGVTSEVDSTKEDVSKVLGNDDE